MNDLVAALVARERAAREDITNLAREVTAAADDRRWCLLALHGELGTWQKVAEATGQTEPAVYKAARQPGKKKP
jgi:hypothetical protein